MRKGSRLVVASAGLAVAALVLTAPEAVGDRAGNPYGGAPGATAVATAAAPAPAAAAAATSHGEVMPVAGTGFDCGDLTGVQTASGAGAPSYTVPSDGVVTGFSHRANATPGAVRGLVMRATTTPAVKTIVGRSALVPTVPSTLMTFPAQIPVVAGDLLGIQVTAGMTCAFAGVPGDSHAYSMDNPDTTSTFTQLSSVDGNRWNIGAVLEPDADKDGYGDVSQDLCPQSAATQAACPAPDVTITKAPKKKTTKRRLKIAFTSTVPGSTFTCAVDGKRARACTSPFKRKYSYGRHRVVVTATSPGGLVDATPAVVKFRVKRPA